MTIEHDAYFIPIEEELLETPQPVSGARDPADPLVVESESDPFIGLTPRVNRFLMPLAVAVLATFILWLGLGLVSTLSALMAWHWLAGGSLLLLLVVVALLAWGALRDFRAQGSELNELLQIRAAADRLRHNSGYGEADALMKRLDRFYRDKPHYASWQAVVAAIPDYHNSRETVNYLTQHWIEDLDRRALKRVNAISQQVGVLVALSPLAVLDLLIAFWRSLRMIDEVAQIYGVTPSTLGRWRMVKMMVNYLLFTSVTQILGDYWHELFSNQLLGALSPRLTQGATVGLYTLVIGLKAMELMRPVPFTEEERPRVGNLFRRLIQWFKER